jgi:type-F conjugative transfer system pilin assembly protein TrbC
MLTWLVTLTGSSVHGAESSCSDTIASDETKVLVEKAKEQARAQGVIDSEATKKAMESARELAKTITIPENKHSAAGKKAAEETNAVYRSKAFQDKVNGYENWEDLVPGAKAKKEQETKGILADSEKIYLFLSSSIPEASFQGYMAYLDGVPEIVPVMKGIVGGLSKENKKERVKWWSKVLKKDTTCKEPEARSEARCEKLKIPITIKPKLFHQYEITEVPALVYTRGDEIFQIQGDVGIVTLLEKVNQEAKSPGINGLIAKISRK